MDYSYTYTTLDEPALSAGIWGFLGAFAGLVVISLIIGIAIAVLTCIAKYRILKCVGHLRPWAAIIPYYSDYEVSLAAQLPAAYAMAMMAVGIFQFALGFLGVESSLTTLIGLVYIVMGSVLGVFMAKAAGYGIGFRIGIAIPGIACIFWMIIAFGDNQLGAGAARAQQVAATVEPSEVTIDDEAPASPVSASSDDDLTLDDMEASSKPESESKTDSSADDSTKPASGPVNFA